MSSRIRSLRSIRSSNSRTFEKSQDPIANIFNDKLGVVGIGAIGVVESRVLGAGIVEVVGVGVLEVVESGLVGAGVVGVVLIGSGVLGQWSGPHSTNFQ